MGVEEGRRVAAKSLQSCPTLCGLWTAAPQDSLPFTVSQSLLKLMSIELVMPSNHLILCRALLLLPSICLHWTKDNLLKFTKAVGYMNIWMEKVKPW